MRALRILHVASYSGEAWAYGGIPRLLRTLTEGLARRGHVVSVCTTDACDASTRLAPASSRTSGGVDVRIFRNLSNSLAYRLQLFLPLGLEKYLRRHAGTFEVAHLHACRNVPGVIAAYHLRRAGVPYVLTPNGTAPRIEQRQLAKRLFDVVEGQRVLHGAARVTAVSNAECRQLSEAGVDARLVRIIPNPVDLDEFASPVVTGHFRRRFALSSGPVILFLGRLTPRKRLDVIARAFARLRRSDAWLVIAGNDMGGGAAARSLVRTLGLEPRTRFTGLLRGRERLEALKDADVMVYPSEHEIFGLAPLESLLSGTPVIVANDSGCGEVVSAIGGGQVIPPGDADALARAIEAVLDDPSGWRAKAVDAAVRVRARFGTDDVCAALEHLYGEMIASG
ncbi:MAG: glycosyltransferase [Acidobacteria bacterium]|nr:glycosyltransferase [Acidobacteriota bacterium]